MRVMRAWVVRVAGWVVSEEGVSRDWQGAWYWSKARATEYAEAAGKVESQPRLL